MQTLNINDIKKLYWKIETINKKHKKAHLTAEIYYCAHIFIGIFILLFKIDYFNAGIDIFINPPTWFGILFPLLTIGKYNISAISILATVLCFIIVPAIISVLVYLLFSASFNKKYALKRNPHKNARNNDVFEKCYELKLNDFNAVAILKNRIHSVVWVQVICFAVLFAFLVIFGAIRGTIKPEEVAMGILCAALVAPSYSIVLYLLRWIECRLFMPMYKMFNAIYKARIKKPLNTIKESSLYLTYLKDKDAKFKAKLERDKRVKEAEKKRRIKNSESSPLYLDDVMRIMRELDNKNKPTPNPDPMGYGDGVPVDGRGI